MTISYNFDVSFHAAVMDVATIITVLDNDEHYNDDAFITKHVPLQLVVNPIAQQNDCRRGKLSHFLLKSTLCLGTG